MARRGIVILMALQTAFFLTGCGGTIPISEEARAEVIGTARTVVSTENIERAGDRTVESELLVLDLDVSSSATAVQREVDGLTSTGWERWRTSEIGVYVSSDEYNVTAVIDSLPSFLQRNSGDKSALQDNVKMIRSKVTNPRGLVIVTLQAHG